MTHSIRAKGRELGRIPSLDGVRAIAVLIVFVAHAGLPVLVNGSTGVTIFFFLSGYLITTLMRVERDGSGVLSVRSFYARRAARILPALYVSILLGVLVVKTGLVEGAIGRGGLISQFLHFSNYWLIIFGREDISPTTLALWSVSVEEHFYLAFPLVFITIARRSRATQIAWLLGLCVAGLAWRTYLYSATGGDFDRIYLATDTRFDSILMGCALALGYNPHIDAIRGSRGLWTWLIVPAAAAAFWFLQREDGAVALTWGYTAQGACLALLFIAIIRFPDMPVARILNSQPFVVLGTLSYSMYLLHQLCIEVVANMELPTWKAAPVSLLLTILAARVMYGCVETPALRLHALLRKRSRAPDAVRS